LAFGSYFVRYLISAILEYVIVGEAPNKVITQQILIASANTAIIAVIDCHIMIFIAYNNLK
jgi:H2-forming N5,N10-methylenetetrahydromethanopterin dehydrogenase-like enzyme